MKKLVLITILISYCVASFGVSINYFYCCGKLKTVSLVAGGEQKNCNTKTERGCCNKKIVTIKLKIDQKISNEVNYQVKTSFSAIIPRSNDYCYGSLASGCRINPLYKRPPPDHLPSRQILYSVFRI